MDSKVEAEVLIGGKRYTLIGHKSEEYLQKMASYVSSKMAECEKEESFRRMPMDMQSVLIYINVADDYFKAKKQIEDLEDKLRAKEEDLHDLKHELVSHQIRLENSEKNVKSLNEKLQENAKKIVRLETELNGKDKKSE